MFAVSAFVLPFISKALQSTSSFWPLSVSNKTKQLRGKHTSEEKVLKKKPCQKATRHMNKGAKRQDDIDASM